MPGIKSKQQRKRSIEAQLALAEHVLLNLNRSIDEEIERLHDLKVQYALALFKCGKAKPEDVQRVIAEQRCRFGRRLQAS